MSLPSDDHDCHDDDSRDLAVFMELVMEKAKPTAQINV